MRSSKIRGFVLLFGLAGLASYKINANSSGASTPKTGAPNETTCTSCHSGSSVVTSGTQHARIKLLTNFTGGGYIPDSTYTFTVTYAESSKSRFGFQMTALTKGGKPAGRFSSTGNRTASFTSSVNGTTRSYVEHTSNGSSSIAKDSTAWTFEWKAPSSNVGDLTMYLALNSTNNNGSSSGDVIYNKTFDISPSSLLPEATAKLKSVILCEADSIAFEGTSTNSATSYIWSFPGGSPSLSTLQKPNVVYTSSGSKQAILQSKNNKGLSLTDTITFTVNSKAVKPRLNVNTATYNLCLGDSVRISTSTSNNHTYKWSNGDTRKSTYFDTSTWVKVLATNSFGCSISSDSLFIVSIPKPQFGVSYGFTDDSVCVGSDLLILLSDSAYTDSFSMFGPNGPYVKSSIIQTNINKGKNLYRFWGKNTFGCITGPIDEREYFGIDTPSGPALQVIQRESDRIVFYWDSVQNASSYEYSIDNGQSWQYPDTGRLHRIQTIYLDSATQTVEFSLRTATSRFCFTTKPVKLRAQGSGCQAINYNLSSKNTVYCKDSTYEVKIVGLDFARSLGLFINGNNTTDTIFKGIATGNETWNVVVIDSNQLICGSYDQGLSIVVDTPVAVQTNLLSGNTYQFCGDQQIANLSYDITNFDSTTEYQVSNGILKRSITQPSDVLMIQKEDSLYFWSSVSKYGCPAVGDSIQVLRLDSINTGFTIDYDIDRYKIKANETDTAEIIHFWYDAIADTLLINTNVSAFDYEKPDNSTERLSVMHEVQYKFNNLIVDTCLFKSTGKQVYLSEKTPQKHKPILFPNPLNSLSELKCANCSEDARLRLWAPSGNVYFDGPINANELINKHLSEGIYLYHISDKLGSVNTRGKLIIRN